MVRHVQTLEIVNESNISTLARRFCYFLCFGVDLDIVVILLILVSVSLNSTRCHSINTYLWMCLTSTYVTQPLVHICSDTRVIKTWCRISGQLSFHTSIKHIRNRRRDSAIVSSGLAHVSGHQLPQAKINIIHYVCGQWFSEFLG